MAVLTILEGPLYDLDLVEQLKCFHCMPPFCSGEFAANLKTGVLRKF